VLPTELASDVTTAATPRSAAGSSELLDAPADVLLPPFASFFLILHPFLEDTDYSLPIRAPECDHTTILPQIKASSIEVCDYGAMRVKIEDGVTKFVLSKTIKMSRPKPLTIPATMQFRIPPDWHPPVPDGRRILCPWRVVSRTALLQCAVGVDAHDVDCVKEDNESFGINITGMPRTYFVRTDTQFAREIPTYAAVFARAKPGATSFWYRSVIMGCEDLWGNDGTAQVGLPPSLFVQQR
jgi:hypothetical protein